MAASSPSKRRHPWVVRLGLLSALLTLLIGAGLWRYLQIDAIGGLLERVDRLDATMRGLRWSGIALIAGFWPALIKQCCRWSWVRQHQADQLLDIRWRVFAWLVFIELMIGTPLLSWFSRYVGS